MAEIELLALYWTSAGPVEVHFGREWSTFDWRDRCAEAARVGFTGIGLWHADIEHQLETRTLREMKPIFDDAGLKYLQVEFLADFFVAPGEPGAGRVRRAAQACCSRPRRRSTPTTSRSATSPARRASWAGSPRRSPQLCQDAANHTDAKVVYEFMPFDVNVNTLDAALELVPSAAPAQRRPGDRHLAHGQARDRARRAQADPARVPGLGRAVRRAVRRTWRTRSTRRSTTAGCRARASSTSPDTSQACREVGYAGPWGVEVLSAELRSCRSSRSSSAHTRRPPRSSAPASHERSS